MHPKQAAALIGTAVVALTLVGTAAAAPAKKAPKLPTLTTVTTTRDPLGTRALVDSSGTVSVVWMKVNSSGGDVPAYGRKPSGAKRFTTVSLPGASDFDSDPFIFQPSHNVLDVLAEYNSSKIVAWRSTNDGKSWKSVNTDSLNASATANGTFLVTSVLYDAPGGPIGAGENGAILQFNAALTSATPIGTAMAAMSNPRLARSSKGTVFQLAWGDLQASVPYQAGSKSGTMTFPACPASAPDSSAVLSLAAGKSGAVALEAACGHIYTRTISASGALGKVVKVGQAVAHSSSGLNGAGNLWGSVVAAGSGHFTAAWIGPAGDVQVARSTSGAKWSVQKKLLPVAYPSFTYGTNEILPSGNPTWYVTSRVPNINDNSEYVISGIPLTDGYTAPGAPSKHGIAHAKSYRLGQLAVTAPGAVSRSSFQKKRHYTLRLVDALGERVSVNISDQRDSSGGVSFICGGVANPKLAAHHVKTLTVTCANDGGGAIAKHDVLAVTVAGRNGTVTIDAKVS